MPRPRAYAARRRPQAPRQTRERITAAVRELLEEGRFHESTVEQVAERAGVARATLYQHFGSRVGLVDALCDTFDENPALLALRETVTLPEWLAHVIDFWATEEKVLVQLYGVVAIDEAARDLVARQHQDRMGEIRRLVRHLSARGELAPGVGEQDAAALLGVVSSFETFLELRRQSGLAQRRVVETVQATASRLLLAE